MKNSIFVLAFAMLFSMGCGNEQKNDNATDTDSLATTDVVSDATNEIEAHSDTSISALTFDEESFRFSIIGYGAKDKSYVVSGMTFKEYEVTSPEKHLIGTTLSFDPSSIDTSEDMNNGLGGEWDATFAGIRNTNIITGFINNMAEKETVTAEITSVGQIDLELEVTINGVSKDIEMSYTVDEEGLLSATGKIDVLDFNTKDAFEKLGQLCTLAFHQGKTWSEVGLEFTVRVN